MIAGRVNYDSSGSWVLESVKKAFAVDKGVGGATAYRDFYDNVAGVVKRGGLQRRPARPSREELEQMGFEVANT
jgi:hypothetical protein